MKVAMYYNNSDVRKEEMPIPEIKDDEILLKTMASGICGSDLLEWYRIKKAPLVLGHEVAGVIEKIGKDVEGYKTGDRVFVTHHVPCGTCKYCKRGNDTACDTLRRTKFYPGGFAEYIRVPAINIEKGMLHLPPSMTYEEATFIEPLGCTVRGQWNLGAGKDDKLLVMGCGPAGILHIKLARAYGVKNIIATDINPYRLAMAKSNGAVPVHAMEYTERRVREIFNGELADKVIVCTGARDAINEAFKCIDRGGSILFFAVPKPGENVPVPLNELWKDEKKILFTYGAGPRDNKRALDFLENRLVDVRDMITHRLPLEQAGEGFRIASEGENAMKVILYPHGMEG